MTAMDNTDDELARLWARDGRRGAVRARLEAGTWTRSDLGWLLDEAEQLRNELCDEANKVDSWREDAEIHRELAGRLRTQLDTAHEAITAARTGGPRIDYRIPGTPAGEGQR